MTHTGNLAPGSAARVRPPCRPLAPRCWPGHAAGPAFGAKTAPFRLCGIGLYLAAAFFMALAVASAANAADGKSAYFSVHLASFKSLKNANAFVNSLAQKGKVVFWKEALIPEKGLFYRVYMGRFDDFDKAGAFWEKLKAEGKVSYRGIHRFKGPVKPPPADRLEAEAVGMGSDLPAAAPVAKPAAPVAKPAAAPVAKPAASRRFIDNGNGTVTDGKTGLMWVQNGWRVDFFSAEVWAEALDKCEAFEFAGHSDWQLPSLDQWRSLIDTRNECPALVDPNPFENIIVHMPYWSRTAVKKVPVKAYTVTLYSGTVYHQKKQGRAFIMPVRVMR